ncbi:MAG: BamA/TamA family outer membrane protein, partial [Acidobacteriota bacterium]
RATLHDYRQWSAGPYSFRRVDLAAEQYVPFLKRTRVVYLGLHASTTTPARGAAVPFFLMPEVGGQVLRGYDLYRFRNRHSVVVTAEYRWTIRNYLDGAVFYDAGKAVAERRDLDVSGLHGSFGAGISLHGPRSTALRLEVARSREGTHFIVSFRPVGG